MRAPDARLSRRPLVATVLPALLLALGLCLVAGPGWAQEPQREAAYRAFPWVGSRLAVWVVAQIHLNFAAFILGVPIFAVIIEFMGWRTGLDRPEGRRYDWLAHEFVKLTFAAFSTTALLGGLLLFFLITLYPKFWTYMSAIFAPTMWLYAALFFLETFAVYLWYYGWEWLSGPRKGIHLALGVLSNLLGTAILVVSNSWVTFMVSPAGVNETGQFTGTLWQAINNYTWMPINIHRLIANIVFGGTVAAAYAAFRFLGARTDEERAQYDWMGYVGNFVAVSALMVLPFAGYWLGFEIYRFNQTMGVTMMGGFMSWLWIVQAILIGVLFLGSNYYLWLGMERIPGSERYRPYIKYLLFVIALGFMVWATPHTLIASLGEVRRMGGTHHKFLGLFGVMSAKNTAVNLMILTTFLSYLLYRRANKVSTKPWARIGMAAQWLVFALAAAAVIGLGVGGYFVEPIIRIVRLSPLQVAAVLLTIVVVMAIDIPMFRGARSTGAIRWGTIAPRSQYVLILLAVTFTWLMGLMGFARSGIRQHWHIYGVMQDTSPDAVTPALGYAANVITITTMLFLGMVMFIFWLGGLGTRGYEPAHAGEAVPPGAPPRAVPIAGGAPERHP
ncbi:MAG TPA: cytochrome ubiquinol oxidase subunit I [Methylomirabilota bacterium]|jgi:cytochrome bd-type quinol oxidase subunit 1|nr:cytochrome ubiquinol oxidase subunit I [Methylomirabilota bacterium]